MQVYEQHTILVPIIFFEEEDEELVGRMILEQGFSDFKAQTHQAIRSRNPKALSLRPEILESFPFKEIDVDTLIVETKSTQTKVRAQLKAFPHSVKLQTHLKSINKQIDFFERIQNSYGVGKCKSIIIIY
jgi:hypothetical protein